MSATELPHLGAYSDLGQRTFGGVKLVVDPSHPPGDPWPISDADTYWRIIADMYRRS